MSESSSDAQVRLNRVSPSYWRIVMNNPPLNLMGPQFLLQFREIMAAIEGDELLKVVVFESAVEAISNTKRLVNAASLTPEVEMAAGWEACMASVARPTTQARLRAFRELEFHKPGDAEDRLGFYLERLNR